MSILTAPHRRATRSRTLVRSILQKQLANGAAATAIGEQRPVRGHTVPRWS